MKIQNESFFNKSRPQYSFERVWSESFHISHLIWQMTLALHSTKSEKIKIVFLNFLEKKSSEMNQIEETLCKTRQEFVDVFYKNMPEPHQEEWNSFVDNISSFQEKLNSALMRLFLLKDVSLQIDEKHPKRKELEEAYQESFNNFLEAKELTDKITCESEKAYKAVHDAIVISRSINENVSFEEADKRERKRWE